MWLVELLKSLPKEWIVFIISATPVIEVRGAVPLGIIFLNMVPSKVVILSVLGSVLPVFPILWFLTFMTDELRKIKMFDRFFEWLFARTRSRSQIIKNWELLGLLAFIAIPFPGTGVWTGCVAAYLFGLRWIPAFFVAVCGTLIASLIMMLASLGLINFFI